MGALVPPRGWSKPLFSPQVSPHILPLRLPGVHQAHHFQPVSVPPYQIHSLFSFLSVLHPFSRLYFSFCFRWLNHCSQTPCIKSLSSNHYWLTDLSFSKLQKWVALFLRSCTSTPTTVLGGGRSSSSSGSRIGSRSAGKGE